MNDPIDMEKVKELLQDAIRHIGNNEEYEFKHRTHAMKFIIAMIDDMDISCEDYEL